MPCRSDYLEASGTELESVRVCQLLIYLGDSLEEEVPGWVRKAAGECYGNNPRLDEATQMLCARLRLLSKDEMERIVYDAHSKDSRRLAGWWERHQEWDAKRVAEEEEERTQTQLRKQARRKLTGEEREALGLDD